MHIVSHISESYGQAWTWTRKWKSSKFRVSVVNGLYQIGKIAGCARARDAENIFPDIAD